MRDETRQAIDAVCAALSTLRVPATPGEYDLHRMIGAALSAAGLPAAHEARLAPRCRVDFWLDGVGIEVKQGPQNVKKLRAQAERYLALEEVEALIVVSTRGVHLPALLLGKPLIIYGLNRLWGVSLP